MATPVLVIVTLHVKGEKPFTFQMMELSLRLLNKHWTKRDPYDNTVEVDEVDDTGRLIETHTFRASDIKRISHKYKE